MNYNNILVEKSYRWCKNARTNSLTLGGGDQQLANGE